MQLDTDATNALVTLFADGRYAEAVTIARQLTAQFPNDGFGWKVLGAGLKQLGQTGEALAPLEMAANLMPTDAEAQNNLGAALKGLGRLDDATSSYRRALRIKPDYADAHGNFGNTLKDLGDLPRAATMCRRALRIRPEFAEAHNSLGNILRDLGNFLEGVASCRRALVIKPEFADAHNNVGNALLGLEHADGAAASYRRALQINPTYAMAHNNLGNALHALGQFEGAMAGYQRALVLTPDLVEAHINYGDALRDIGEFESGCTSCRRALSVKPDSAEAYNNLGKSLRAMRRLEEAELCYHRALAIRPGYSEALNHLGDACKNLGRRIAAEACCRRALAINPDLAEAGVALAMLTLPIAPRTEAESASAPEEFDRALGTLAQRSATPGNQPDTFHRAVCSQQPFYLAYRAGNHVDRMSYYGDLVAKHAGHSISFQRDSTRSKVRLVVVSSHFRRHPVWEIIVRGLLVSLNRQRFEVILYHNGIVEDEETVFARSLADSWRDTDQILGLNGWLGAMGTDRPDVIFYPELGMDPMTLSLASCRLAPLQVASWGHPMTTGLPTIDLYLSGELIEPLDGDTHYREQLVRLPGTGCCTAPLESTPEQLAGPKARLTEGNGPCFVIAQTPFKFDPSDDALFASIAASLGDCTFILLRHPRFCWATDIVLARLNQAFRVRGLVPEHHFLVMPWLSPGPFCTLLNACDVYLDCPSFSGYTTARQAIHCGLPIVTLEGEFMRQRLAAGLLRRVGLTETIAVSADHYLNIAVRLANESRDPDRRAARRRAIKSAAASMDNDIRVVRAFETCLIDALSVKRLAASTDSTQSIAAGNFAATPAASQYLL